MTEWDPIGVNGIPEAADEYDSYVGTVYVMLMDHRASAKTLAAYLFDTATNYIGLSASKELAGRCQTAATTLVRLRPEFETH
jgi:hypothetical protein